MNIPDLIPISNLSQIYSIPIQIIVPIIFIFGYLTIRRSMKKRMLPLILVLIFTVWCGKSTHQSEQQADDKSQVGHTHEGEAHNHLHISENLIKKWGIYASKPEERDWVEKISLTGVVRENSNTTFLVNSMVCGVVHEILKDIGDPVRRGHILCVLNSPEWLTLKSKYIQAFQNYHYMRYNHRQYFHEIIHP